MIFTVLWSEDAESRLAEEWLSSPDRRAVAEAADRIDALLRHDAHKVGESRPENRRIIHDSPLGAIYTVNEQDRIVLVLDVWRY